MIDFIIEDRDGTRQTLEVPEGINLSLMEVLKASEYNILATCGGMALCATCHVRVVDGSDNLAPAQDAELDMLDTLPDADQDSRLSCQLRVDESLRGGLFRIRGEIQ